VALACKGVGIENPVHLLFIAIVALVVLGPKRLPRLARALGDGIREFRAALTEGAERDPELERSTGASGGEEAGEQPRAPGQAG
jgi:sec-independent protein translocase protein TatA